MSFANATDNGANIRWLRAAPHINEDLINIVYRSFILDISVGAGQPSGNMPLIIVDWSNDNGQSYEPSINVPIGKIGEYLTRVRVNQCGIARARNFRVVGSDPVPQLALVAAYLITELGST
jgi:hypothetical protein